MYSFLRILFGVCLESHGPVRPPLPCKLQESKTNDTSDSLVQPTDPDDPEQNPSDLTIKCGSLDVKTHSFVLCQDSSYLEIICKGSFLVNSQHYQIGRSRLADNSIQEAQTREINFPAEEEFLIRRLLCYRYTTGYRDEPYDDEITPPPDMKAPAYVSRLHINAQMYSIGDKYYIPSLKEKAAEKFEAAIWEPKYGIYHNGSKLVDEMLKVIPLIYESTPDRDRGLRDRVIEVATWRQTKFEEHPGLQDVIAAVPEFGKEIKVLLPSYPGFLLARALQFSQR